MTSEVFAPAKINLTLHVTGQRPDGYHLLDSLVVFANIGDRLWITPSSEMSLNITGPFAAGVPADARNLVWQAARLAGQTAQITLEKNLPHGAGIGGGSSDAAAVLRHFGATQAAASLGADVPVCLAASAQRMQGVGEILTPLHLPPLHAVLVNPGVHLATPDVFNALAQKENQAMPELPSAFRNSDAVIEWLASQRNDLEAPAKSLSPMIALCLNALAALPQTALVRMSGSGSTCFALCKDATTASDAAAQMIAEHPDWWVQATTLS